MTAYFQPGCLSVKALRSSRPILQSATRSTKRGLGTSNKDAVTERLVYNEAQFAKYERDQAADRDKSWRPTTKLVAPPNRADVARRAMTEWERARMESEGKANEDRPTWDARLQPYHSSRGHQRVPKKNVLVIRHLNQNLVHEDFYRTFPPGMDPQTVRVIPCRSKTSGYKRTNSYWLVFPTPEARDIWRRWIDRMAREARRYTVETLQHPAVAPPAGFISKGLETDIFVKGWALLPPRQLHSATDLESVRNFEDDDVIQLGGYEAFIPESERGRTQPYVILDVKGTDLEPSDILQAIAYDGVRRNLVWNVWSAMKYVAPLEDASAAAGSTTRWKIPFQTVRDASNFARTWHARPFPWPPSSYKLSPRANHTRIQAKNPTKVTTELAW